MTRRDGRGRVAGAPMTDWAGLSWAAGLPMTDWGS